ncbi:hypothetical protein D3C86_1608930 [compost metagenome]
MRRARVKDDAPVSQGRAPIAPCGVVGEATKLRSPTGLAALAASGPAGGAGDFATGRSSAESGESILFRLIGRISLAAGRRIKRAIFDVIASKQAVCVQLNGDLAKR